MARNLRLSELRRESPPRAETARPVESRLRLTVVSRALRMVLLAFAGAGPVATGGCGGTSTMGTTQGGPSSSVAGTATPTPIPSSSVAVGLAGGYSRDIGIERDPDVIFTEMAEEPSLGALFSNWNGDSTANSVALDRGTVPPLSTGQQSIRLFTTAAPTGAGGVRSAGLYKFFPEGYEGTLYARWYVKYNAVGTFHHSGPRLGGNNPGSPSQPTSPAGVRPNGSDFFYLGAELSGAKTAPSPRSPVDFYNYWMHQRGS